MQKGRYRLLGNAQNKAITNPEDIFNVLQGNDWNAQYETVTSVTSFRRSPVSPALISYQSLSLG